jgi:hypothetical protein
MRGPGPVVNDMTDLIVPVALRIWIIFLLVFTVLGYAVGFSILFGALGGFMGGIISAWWQVMGGEPLPSEGQDASPNKAPSLASLKLPKWQPGREKRHLRRRQRQRRR